VPPIVLALWFCFAAIVVSERSIAPIVTDARRAAIWNRICLAVRRGRLLLLPVAECFYVLSVSAQAVITASTENVPSSINKVDSALEMAVAEWDGSADTESTPRLFLHPFGIVEEPKDVQFTSLGTPTAVVNYVSLPPAPEPRFDFKRTLLQEFEYLTVEHGFRLMQDPKLRSQLVHSPFFHNWAVSFKGYDLKRWGDGDDFLVNDIAHPMQGAVAGWIYLQNSPVGSTRTLGTDRQYWTSRLKAMAWAAAFEVQWKIGPLSETSIGNAGGWAYVPNCGYEPKCINDPHYPPPTNNTGLSDWIMTPVGGVGWIVMEDAIDKYIASPVGAHNKVAGIVLRSALEPTRNFAAMFNGVMPWNREYGERRFIRPPRQKAEPESSDDSWRKYRRSVGVNFVNVNLPGVETDCLHCRENHQGIGFPYEFRLSDHFYFDCELNRFTGNSSGAPALEGLFGAKFGERGKNWGLFAKLRPGFIYYKDAWSGGENPHRTDLSRFALDAGGTVEFYPDRRSAIRVDFGTTLVRYLQDYPNPNLSTLSRLISTDYYVTQGNLQISTGYRLRF
jgi:hypothetical protein